MRLNLRVILRKNLPENVGIMPVFSEINIEKNNLRTKLQGYKTWHSSSQAIFSGFIISGTKD